MAGTEYIPVNIYDLTLCAINGIKARYIYGQIGVRLASAISARLINENLNGYSIGLTSDGLTHFLNRHFDETTELAKGNLGIHFADIQNIFDYVRTYTSVSYGNKQNTIFFKKRASHKTYEMVFEIDRVNKVLWGKSFRIRRT